MRVLSVSPWQTTKLLLASSLTLFSSAIAAGTTHREPKEPLAKHSSANAHGVLHGHHRKQDNALPDLIPRSVLFGPPAAESPRINPVGDKLAFLAPGKDGTTLNIFVRPLSGGKPEQLTFETTRSIDQFVWHDDKHILYLHDNGDENSHLYQIDLSKSPPKIRDLTPFPDIQAKIVSANPEYPNEILVAMNRRTPYAHDVYRITLSGDAEPTIALDTQNPGSVVYWLADNKNQVRAAKLNTDDGGGTVLFRETSAKPWRAIYRTEPKVSQEDGEDKEVPGFSKDDRYLRVASANHSGTYRLEEIDTVTGKMRPVAGGENLDFDIADVLFGETSKEIQATVFDENTGLRWNVVDKAQAGNFHFLLGAFKGRNVAIVSRDRGEKSWVVRTDSDVQAPAYYLYKPYDRTLSLIFQTRPELNKYTLAHTQSITYHSDGLKVFAFLTLPATSQGKEHPCPVPLIVLNHGGPWWHDSWGFDPRVQWYVNRGAAVLQVEFPSSTGRGPAYESAGDRQWAGTIYRSIKRGIQWCVEKGYALKNKIAPVGDSFGGYVTLLSLTQDPNDYACGVDVCGISNLPDLLGTLPPWWKGYVASLYIRVGDPKTELPRLKAESPFYRVHQVRAPLFIAQGGEDPRVKQAQSDQMVAAVRAEMGTVTYFLAPKQGHVPWDGSDLQAERAGEELFLGRWLGTRVEKARSPKENYVAYLK